MTRHMLAVVLVALSSIASAADENKATANRAPNRPISVKNFGRGNVTGHLGHPLGTIVRVSGVCVDGDTTRRRADLGKTLLKITMVNGTKLKHPFIVPFHRAAKGIRKPKHGERFDYYAHEWGEFDGIVHVPKGLKIDRPLVANDGFHYRPQITIHKVNPIANASP